MRSRLSVLDRETDSPSRHTAEQAAQTQDAAAAHARAVMMQSMASRAKVAAAAGWGSEWNVSGSRARSSAGEKYVETGDEGDEGDGEDDDDDGDGDGGAGGSAADNSFESVDEEIEGFGDEFGESALVPAPIRTVHVLMAVYVAVAFQVFTTIPLNQNEPNVTIMARAEALPSLSGAGQLSTVDQICHTGVLLASTQLSLRETTELGIRCLLPRLAAKSAFASFLQHESLPLEDPVWYQPSAALINLLTVIFSVGWRLTFSAAWKGRRTFRWALLQTAAALLLAQPLSFWAALRTWANSAVASGSLGDPAALADQFSTKDFGVAMVTLSVLMLMASVGTMGHDGVWLGLLVLQVETTFTDQRMMLAGLLFLLNCDQSLMSLTAASRWYISGAAQVGIAAACIHVELVDPLLVGGVLVPLLCLGL